MDKELVRTGKEIKNSMTLLNRNDTLRLVTKILGKNWVIVSYTRHCC